MGGASEGERVKAHLCVIGAGRSGAVTAACLAQLGHRVCAVDVDQERVVTLRSGRAPFFEPGLDELISGNLNAGRLTFTSEYADAVPGAEFVLLSVDTPPRPTGEADLSSLTAAAQRIAPLLADDAVVVTRSTVPIGTNAELAKLIHVANPDATFAVVSNPEFLREGHAVDDFQRPERIVIGAAEERAGTRVAALYGTTDRPVILTDLETAELIKYAANAYLATSISFINEIANIADRFGADVGLVAEALALDRRIGGDAYLRAGIGFGGSCLPKDLRALVHTAELHGYTPTLLRAIVEVNERQPKRVLASLEEFFADLARRPIAVLGLSFKGDTFDLRSSPAVAAIHLLLAAGARVRVFDPLADQAVPAELEAQVELCPDAYTAVEGCDAVIVATDHSVFRALDLEKLRNAMRSPVFIDARNAFDPAVVAQARFVYRGIGRGSRHLE